MYIYEYKAYRKMCYVWSAIRFETLGTLKASLF